MSRTQEVCVTAINVLDGVYSVATWEDIAPKAERDGWGFTEFAYYIADTAEYIDDMRAVREPQNFPGVFDYDVSCFVGVYIAERTIREGKVPAYSDVLDEVRKLVNEFFARGEEE